MRGDMAVPRIPPPAAGVGLADVLAWMTSCGLSLDPWQQRVLELFYAKHPPSTTPDPARPDVDAIEDRAGERWPLSADVHVLAAYVRRLEERVQTGAAVARIHAQGYDEKHAAYLQAMADRNEALVDVVALAGDLVRLKARVAEAKGIAGAHGECGCAGVKDMAAALDGAPTGGDRRHTYEISMPAATGTYVEQEA